MCVEMRIFDPRISVGCPQGCAAEVTGAAEHENKAIKARPRRAEAVKADRPQGLGRKGWWPQGLGRKGWFGHKGCAVKAS